MSPKADDNTDRRRQTGEGVDNLECFADFICERSLDRRGGRGGSLEGGGRLEVGVVVVVVIVVVLFLLIPPKGFKSVCMHKSCL